MRNRFRWRALTSVSTCLALLFAGLVAVATQAQAAPGCKVTYSKNDWGSGFVANVDITNTGDAWTSWTLTYAYGGNQTLQGSGWGGVWSQSGRNITVRNASWNGNVGTNTTINVGAQFTYSGTNDNPTAFSVNGTPCGDPQTNPPTVTMTSPTAGATFAVGAQVPLAATATAGTGTVSQVQFFNQNGLLGTDTSSPYTFTWTPTAGGNYSLFARVTNSGGTVAESPPVGVTVTPTSTPSVVASATALTVQQSGQVTYGIKLTSQPTANVTVTTARTSGNTGLTVTAGATRTFSTTNWQTEQTVTVSADAAGTGVATFTSSAPGYTSAAVSITESPGSGNSVYVDRFLAQYDKIKAPANGYFSPEGIPYHSVETFMVEAPDHGHETTSEAYSYLIWLEAMYGRITQNWAPFNASWALMEKYMIPTAQDQQIGSYDPSAPATYAAEHPLPENYPSPIESSIPTGDDPIARELQSAYGTNTIYGMHWLQDVDNVYGFGNTPGGGCEAGPTADGPSYINTYQRGPQESVFETIPQPTCDDFKFGGTNGYLDLFIRDSSYAQQWKFTDAPDADARAIQAAYMADTWAKQQNKGADVATTVGKAGKMGDYLRYAFFDKYFKRIGDCFPASSCPGVSDKSSAHYLLSWYYAWGGARGSGGNWSWRIGDGASHFGYQNPMAAYALTNNTTMAPKGSTAVADWRKSMTRQLQFYKWLQSAEGAIAGGATNSWGGSYSTPPAGLTKFFGMAYDWQPVYHDPPSNQWFGFQVWSMQRVAELYDQTGNADAKALMDKWVAWVLPNVTANATTGAYSIPSTLGWTGQPDANWSSDTGMPPANTGLHVSIVDSTNDVGTTAALARTLSAYAHRSGNTQAKTTAKNLLDAMWRNQDTKGVSVEESKADYRRVDDPIFVPSGWSGRTPLGDTINSSSTFMSIRSFYRNDPDFARVWAFATGTSSTVPVFRYHRFWAQADIALAMADYGLMFNE